MSGREDGIRRVRAGLGLVGVLLVGFGVLRLLTEVPGSNLLGLALWLGGALVLHDAVLAPGIVGIGGLLRRIPPRARSYVQGALVAGGLVTVIALPMMYRAGRQPPAEAILEQNFVANLAVLVAVVAAAAVLAYLRRVARERSRRPVDPDRTP